MYCSEWFAKAGKSTAFALATRALAFDFADARFIVRVELGGRLRVFFQPASHPGCEGEAVPAGVFAGTL
jgi:hypothetical protein